MAANCLAGAVVSVLVYLVIVISQAADANLGSWLFRIPAVIAISAGLGFGTVQWLVLRRYLVDLEMRDWVRVTVIGWFFAGFLTFCQLLSLGSDKASNIEDAAIIGFDAAVGYSAPRAIIGLVLGALLGIAISAMQWLLLESYFRRARIWAFLNIGAYTAAGGASSFLVVLLDALGYPTSEPISEVNAYNPLDDQAVLVGQGAFFLIAAVLTGLTMLWLLRQPLLHYWQGKHEEEITLSRRRVLS